MAPLVAIATLRVREGREEPARAALAEAQRHTHEEPGCRLYALHQERSEPRTFVMIEIWDSDADLAAHLERPHIKELIAKGEELFEGPPQIQELTALPAGASGKGVVAAMRP